LVIAPTGSTLASFTRSLSRSTNSICDSLSSARLRVGHAADGREPAGDGGGGTAGDRLFFLVAGLAEMDVDVYQAGDDVLAGGVDDVVRLARRSRRG
jgi:hypothetical protein